MVTGTRTEGPDYKYGRNNCGHCCKNVWNLPLMPHAGDMIFGSQMKDFDAPAWK